MATQYKRPPISEAVIEIMVDTPVERGTLDKLQARLLEQYPFSIVGQAYEVELSDAGARVKKGWDGYRLTGTDGADLVLLKPTSIGTVRQPPYEGWEKFVARARENWSIWRRIAGPRKVSRVGVRYINRIDIPNPDNRPVTLSDYISVYVHMPPLAIGPMLNFAINSTFPLGEDGLKLILNVGTTPSPLVRTISLVLDLDVSREGNVQNDDELWALIGRIRHHKNRVFEQCITDQSRELFSK